VEKDAVVKLENFCFSGLDASQLGAIKSVADYYQIPLTPSKIYGMTGLAFLFILDEGMVQPNAGPPEPEIFPLTRNLGVDIKGMHQYAEGEPFARLQEKAWEKARQAIDSKKPVFAKNLDIENQTSVIIAYDDVGYYTHSWHTGYERCDDVIPWNALGLSRCPCINCVTQIQSSKPASDSEGLISLHWADRIPVKDDVAAFREALDFVMRLNEEGTYTWSGQKYFVGLRAYEHWITGLKSNRIQKFWFSLIMEVLNEARYHATIFLCEMKHKFNGSVNQSIEDAISLYREISERCNLLKTRFPYEQPRELLSDAEREETIEILKEISALEKDALVQLMKIQHENNQI
jgi:hypothetical protein